MLIARRFGYTRLGSPRGDRYRRAGHDDAAAAVDEGALDTVRTGERPRSVIWVAGRGTAESAGAILATTQGASAAEPIVTAAEVPPWIGPLDVLVVAGDDPGDPVLVAAAATGVRRGARVVVAVPYEGPLRDATAGRVAVLAPRLWVPEEFSLCRYLAVGLAVLRAVDTALSLDLNALADELDTEALRSSAGREMFTNPAKALAQQISGHPVVLAGDSAATLALARHASATILRTGHRVVAAAGLTDALMALREGGGAGFGSGIDDVAALFHDEEIDGPLADRLRILALVLSGERPLVSARIAGVAGAHLVGTEDVPDGGSIVVQTGRPEQQLVLLAVRMELAAVYLRLAG